MPPAQLPKVGDRVGVPWGLDVLEGVVLRTYDTPNGVRALVSVEIPGVDEDSAHQTLTLRAADLHLTASGEELEAPGEWVSEYQFAKEVTSALERVVHLLDEPAQLETEPRFGNRRPDALIRFENLVVVIEAKISARIASAAAQILSYLELAQSVYPAASVHGLVVIQHDIESQELARLRSMNIAVVEWRNRRDDRRLVRQLEYLIETSQS